MQKLKGPGKYPGPFFYCYQQAGSCKHASHSQVSEQLSLHGVINWNAGYLTVVSCV
jgi:hypothetical protein